MTNDPDNASLAIRRINTRNFKGLGDYSVSLEALNVLVGPNNSGKSTIIGVLRALAVGMRTARARLPERLGGPFGLSHGYRLLMENLPISLENARAGLSDEPATATITLTNDNRIHLYFPDDRTCWMFAEHGDTAVSPRDTRQFIRGFNISLGVVPVLGPVEHKEELVEERTVDRNIATHRASRTFRSYWYYHRESFENFRRLLIDSWPGMDIEFPEIADQDSRTLAMFCLEDRMTREMFWAGFGFQIWCQILTHVVRSEDADVIVVDEPETYLHPDLQRRLFRLLSAATPQVILATHSTEMLAEAEPRDILLIDKKRRSARRLGQAAGMSPALAALGSYRTAELTAIARCERVVFVEGSDTRLLQRLAYLLAPSPSERDFAFVTMPLAGHQPRDARAMAKGISEALGTNVRFGLVLDSDYRSDQEISDIQTDLNSDFEFVHIHRRKELENYLLVPNAIDRATSRELRRAGRKDRVGPLAGELLGSIAASMRLKVQAQRVEKAQAWLRSRRDPRDASTIHEEVVRQFEAAWEEQQIALIPGKEALAALNRRLQDSDGLSVSMFSIVDEMQASDLPADITLLLRRLIRFRKSNEPEQTPR
jgi:energy-coupling factor transporter ATP-binding protein EcfA2